MWGSDLSGIVQEQFWLSKKGNISISESNQMAEFERASYVNLLVESIKKETQSIEALNT